MKSHQILTHSASSAIFWIRQKIADLELSRWAEMQCNALDQAAECQEQIDALYQQINEIINETLEFSPNQTVQQLPLEIEQPPF